MAAQKRSVKASTGEKVRALDLHRLIRIDRWYGTTGAPNGSEAAERKAG
jgi:hypothetical protein